MTYIVGLPPKWYIDRCLSDEIVKWFNKKFNQEYSTSFLRGSYLCLPPIDESQLPHSTNALWLLQDYEQITLEQFKTYILKREKMGIIGYKCPADLFGGNPEVAKGTVFVKRFPEHHWYTPEKEKEKSAPNYILPKEIVETWEPVYQQFNIDDFICVTGHNTPGATLKIGDVVKIIGIGNNFVRTSKGDGGDLFYSDFRLATPKEIEDKLVIIGGYSAVRAGDVIQFGCQNIHKDLLVSLKNLLERTTFNFECNVGNTKITLDHINKLLKL